MPNQSQPTTPPHDPLPDLSGISYYEPYLIPQPLLPPLGTGALFAPHVDLNYFKYYTNLVSAPPADSACSQFGYAPYYMNLARSQAGLGSPLVATSPATVLEHSACPSPAPTSVNTLDSELSPEQTIKSEISSNLLLIPESTAITISSPSSSSSITLKSFSRAPERSLDDDNGNNPLEPVSLDEDPAARKRRQNTIAARRSRLRKMARMEELECNVASLEKDKIKLETRLAVLESEKQGAVQRADDAAARIRSLEAQLLEVYKSQRS